MALLTSPTAPAPAERYNKKDSNFSRGSNCQGLPRIEVERSSKLGTLDEGA